MVIKAVLREELENSLGLKKKYEEELNKLPKGSLCAKKVKRHVYYYLITREKGKVKFAYKGKASDAEKAKYKEAGKMRAKYRNMLSRVKKQITFLRSALRGKEEI